MLMQARELEITKSIIRESQLDPTDNNCQKAKEKINGNEKTREKEKEKEKEDEVAALQKEISELKQKQESDAKSMGDLKVRYVKYTFCGIKI